MSLHFYHHPDHFDGNLTDKDQRDCPWSVEARDSEFVCGLWALYPETNLWLRCGRARFVIMLRGSICVAVSTEGWERLMDEDRAFLDQQSESK
jgi:hypothetical protein